mgnify:CR=1 FL=1
MGRPVLKGKRYIEDVGEGSIGLQHQVGEAKNSARIASSAIGGKKHKCGRIVDGVERVCDSVEDSAPSCCGEVRLS